MVHPPIEPFATGRVPVAGGAEIYWEASGNPEGRPALYLHGGPGSGLGHGGYRRHFDPALHLVIGIDQRGCGRSTPLVIDDLEGIDTNTTATVIDDIEAVREHLGVDRWLVTGVSWGSTLALAYAEAHPTRVSEVAVVAVTTTSRPEVEWITETMGRVFPEAWERFEAASGRVPGERIVEAYARRLAAVGEAFEQDRERAATDWDAWENTHISLDPQWSPGDLHPDPARRRVFATLVAHYWSNDGFLTGGDEILARIDALRGIPGVLIHGRRDISGPAVTPFLVHQAWPESRLVIIEGEGHGGPLSMQALCNAVDGFARA